MVPPGPNSDTGPAAQAGDYSNKSMQELYDIALAEHTKLEGVQKLSRIWFKTGSALEDAGISLRSKALKVRAHWHDDSYQVALGNYLDKGVVEVERAIQPAWYAGGVLSSLASQITTTEREVRRLKYDYEQHLSSSWNLTTQDRFDPTRADKANQLRQEAVQYVNSLARHYSDATKALKEASNESAWTGPNAVNGAAPPTSPGPASPTVSGPQSQPPQQPVVPQPGGQQPGGEHPAQQGQQPTGQLPGPASGPGQGVGQPGNPGPGKPGLEHPGTGDPGIGDPGTGGPGGGETDRPGNTGLSGGQTGAPTLPKVPEYPTASTANALPPVGGGIGSSGGVGGGASTGGGASRIDQAARNLTAPPAANAGRAPGLAASATETPSASSAGGGRPMMPPMMPPGAGAGAGGDNSQPRPGTAQAAGAGRSRPSGATTGVPSGLRGRVGSGDGGARATTANRRQRRDGPQTVEMLDSELWEVEQPKPAAASDQSPSRQAGTPRPAN